MAYHPFTWSKTDATPDRWPSVGRNGAPDVAWYEAVPTSGSKYELYETKVGQHVARKLSLPGNGASHWCFLPDRMNKTMGLISKDIVYIYQRGMGYSVIVNPKQRGRFERTFIYLVQGIL
jgi:hypothetical protein